MLYSNTYIAEQRGTSYDGEPRAILWHSNEEKPMQMEEILYVVDSLGIYLAKQSQDKLKTFVIIK